MNTYKLSISVFTALAIALFTSFSVFAYPAGGVDDSAPLSYRPSPCSELLMNAQAMLNRIDIPSHRVDYQRIDRIATCLVPSGEGVVPITGATLPAMDADFATFKELQAERMSP